MQISNTNSAAIRGREKKKSLQCEDFILNLFRKVKPAALQGAKVSYNAGWHFQKHGTHLDARI